MLNQLRHIRFTKLNGRSLSSTEAFAKEDCTQQYNSMNPIGVEKDFIHKRLWYIQT